MQIVKFFKFQVRIISLGALYQDEESSGSMTVEINLKKQQDSESAHPAHLYMK